MATHSAAASRTSEQRACTADGSWHTWAPSLQRARQYIHTQCL